MSIDIVDDSDTALADPESLVRQAAFLLDRLHLDSDADLSIALVTVDEMTRLHVEWMGEPGPTDVLSFPMDDLVPGDPSGPRVAGILGDVIICPDVARQQATEAGHPVSDEISLLLTHGILHLLGFDHAEPDEHARMFALQDSLLADWRQHQGAHR